MDIIFFIFRWYFILGDGIFICKKICYAYEIRKLQIYLLIEMILFNIEYGSDKLVLNIFYRLLNANQ